MAVVIDVFRAFSVECYLVRNGVKKIIPVASEELAYELRRKNPGYLLIGERHGVMLPGFDYGNSPAEIEDVCFSGRTVVHTTSAGTQGLESAAGARVVLTGSLCNARAVVGYIKENHPDDEISLVCMGNNGVTEAREDELCAEYIRALLEGGEPDISGEIEALKAGSGRRFFDAALRDVFPKRDFYLCTALDSFDFVLRFQYDGDGLGYITVERRMGGPGPATAAEPPE